MISLNLTGATRLNVIIGDPIAQVKSPGGVTKAFTDRGHDAVLVPVQIDGDHLEALLTAVDGRDKSRRHHRHGATQVRLLRVLQQRHRAGPPAWLGQHHAPPGEGGWHGDIVDGLGFVGAVRTNGGDPAGKRALQIGAGGAGSAIAMALVEAGVRSLAIHDTDVARRDQLIAKLKTVGRGEIHAGHRRSHRLRSGRECDAARHETGRSATDRHFEAHVRHIRRLCHHQPAVSPLIEAARRDRLPDLDRHRYVQRAAKFDARLPAGADGGSR